MTSPAPARVACVLGTRPEVVKMAPVIAALARDPRFTPVVINTGQHRELLAETMTLFGIVPDVALDLMQPGQRLAGFLGRCVESLDRALFDMDPAAVVAQGDTSTVLAAALCAFYQDRPFFHVEAGLRTGDFRNPFPEEMNREVASRFAALHFAPTEAARANLLAERVPDGRIVVTGNTVIDALLMVRDLAFPHGLPLDPKRRLIVVTAHRRENFGAPMRGMLRALKAIASRWPDVEIVYPAHPNPEVRRAIADEIGESALVRVVEPLSYGPFVSLLDEATLILTDSGGIQEEAPALGKPVLVLRDETERPEAIDAGVARLVGTDEARIVEETARLLDDPAWYRQMARGASPYGDGQAARRIVAAIGRHLEATARPR
ncbi:MAG: UDP-N-acetylglucosamine 2-epimerase (non-hydrolyzing) [Betaproteobacteria bacterium]|nr:UDP-N-acetylglucosamine 2-epimerase (non-hydrolyzing) [Betaproteobacteria bacterium]